MTTTATNDLAIRGLHSTTPERLPFAPEHEIRAFLLEREPGNLLIYSTGQLASDVAELQARGGAVRQYLNHWHEAMFGLAPAALEARLLHHEAEAPHVVERGGRGLTFSRRHHLDADFTVIPTPGHTPGATAYLWDSGGQRLLFTGDSLYLDGDDWVAAVLSSSDRDAYIASLELIRGLDFDVLVPWASSVGGPTVAFAGAAERRRRIDAVLARLRRGGDR